MRFGLDFLRESSVNGGDVRYLGLTPGHYASVAMFVAGIVVAIRVARGPAATLWLDGAPPESEPSATPDAGKSKSARRDPQEAARAVTGPIAAQELRSCVCY